jgi:hypothetical protein
MGCLNTDHQVGSGRELLRAEWKDTNFFAVKNIFPSRRGRRGMTRSSARKSAFSRSKARRASNDLNFPLSFSIPTTRLINWTPASSRRSLYSRCGSLVMRQMADVRGSTRGYFIGLSDHTACKLRRKSRRFDAHFMGFQFCLSVNLLYSNLKPDILFLSGQQFALFAFFLLLECIFHQGRDGTPTLFD